MTTQTLPTDAAPARRDGRTPFYADEVNRRDRDRVTTLVRRVGEASIRFSLFDVKRAAHAGPPQLVLERPTNLVRHLRALVGSTIVRLGPEDLLQTVATEPVSGDTTGGATLAHVSDTREADRGVSRISQGVTYYVLAHRADLLRAGPPQLSDLERAYVALWVASAALGQASVPTAAVSAVQKVIGDLALLIEPQVSNPLGLMARRGEPVVRMHPPDEHGWVRWEPLAGAPLHPQLDAWIAQVRDQDHPAHGVIRARQATASALVRELIELAIAATVSPRWPTGHSVGFSDMNAVAGRDARAREITTALRRSGRSLGATLGDTCKERLGTVERVQQQVAKVSEGGERSILYDLPGRPGYAQRILIVPFRRLMREASNTALAAIRRELNAARQLAETASRPNEGVSSAPSRRDAAQGLNGPDVHEAYRLIGAARQILALESLEELLGHAQSLTSETRLSNAVRKEVREREHAIRAALEEGGGVSARASLIEELYASGMTKVPAATDRPLLVGAEYAAYLSPTQRRGRSSAVLLGNAKSLRRFPNPRHTRRNDRDPSAAAAMGVDRVEALAYAADFFRGRTYPLLMRARRLLGPDLRDARFALRLLDSPRWRDRQLALATLVALGAPEAAGACHAVLADETALADHVVDALHGLLMLRRVVPSEWPDHVRNATSSLIRAAVRDVQFAARDGRWLLQP